MWAEFNPQKTWQCRASLSSSLSLQMGVHVWKIQQNQHFYVFKFVKSSASKQNLCAHLDEIHAYQHALLAQLHLPYQVASIEDFAHIDGIFKILRREGLSQILILPFVEPLNHLKIFNLSLTDKIEIFMKMTHALHILHAKGYVHGDLKPEHFFYDNHQVGLLDFAQLQSIESKDGVTQRGGTPAYMAPELFLGQPKTIQTDLYAMGIILHQFLMQTKPYVAHTYQHWAILHCQQPIPELKGNLRCYQNILDGLLAKRMENRFGSTEVLLNALNINNK